MNHTKPVNFAELRQRLRRRVRAFSRVRRGVHNATLAYRFGSIVLAAAVLLLGLSAVPGIPPLLDAVLVLGGVVLVLALVFCYAWQRLRFDNDLSEAFRIEELSGDLESRLVSALDFLDREIETPLTRAVVAEADRHVERDFEARLDRRVHKQARRYCLLTLLLAIILGLSPQWGLSHLADRVNLAWLAVREQMFPTEWELSPGPGRHVNLLGETVDVGLRFTRNGFNKVTLLQGTPEEEDTGDMRGSELPVAEDGTTRAKVQGNTEGTRRVIFEFGRQPMRTAPMDLVFTSRPIIENMQIEMIPPVYTRQPPRDLDGVQTRIAGLPGTRVSMGLTFSKELKHATVRFQGDLRDIPLDVVGRFATIQFVISEAQRIQIQIEDIHGFGLRRPHSLEIDLLTDEQPRIAVPGFLKAEMPIKADQLSGFGFGVRAWDDYGVARTVLKWRQSTLDNRNMITAQGEIERPSDPPLATVIVEFTNAFAEQQVKPGDLITFHVEVADNRQPDANAVSSPTFSFFVYQDELGSGAGMEDDLLFASLSDGGRGRVARHRASTEVPPPQDLRAVSQLRSEYEDDVASDSRPPTVRGDFGESVQRYFEVLSSARFKEDEKQ